MKKQPERTAKTKQALIDSFWELYKEKSIEKITVREITSNAGFYRSTFYEYFGSVYDVLEAIENDLMDKFSETLPRLFVTASLQEAFSHIIKLYEENGVYMAVLLGPTGDKAFLAKAKDMMKGLISSKTDFNIEDTHLELAIEMVSSSIISMLNYWYNHKDVLPLDEVVATGSSIMQNGALPYLKSMGLEISW